ncbi:MAG TPA: hypothetical protein VII72_06745 [Myxococcota bacterium]|jgi:hypothetical protein
MYFCRQPPPEREAKALRALHLSLNTPVVAIEDLPVGPARAAIAVQDAPEGRASLMLVLRSQRTGQLACFAPDEMLESDVGAQIALDGALSFAESMGFLFDDDAIPELGAEGPREAADSWNDLLGIEPHELEVDPDPEPEPAPAEAPPEIWLEEAVPAAAAGGAVSAPPHPVPPTPAGILLTKFRRAAAPGRRSRRNGFPIRLLSNF